MKLPYAKDGSTIDETCRYDDGYFRIGAKGKEVKVKDLSEAILLLSQFETAHWRRRSATSGVPGIVSAVRWE